MRDIREDLQDRASFLRREMDAAKTQYETSVNQIKKEHASRLEGLKSALDAVNTVMGAEQRRLGDTLSVSHAPPQPPEDRPQQPQPPKARARTPLAEMIGLQRAS